MYVIYAIVFLFIYACICVIASSYYASWFTSVGSNEAPSVIDNNYLIDFARWVAKKTFLCMVISPFTMTYLLGWRLGFIIYKLKIKGKYEDRFAPWVI